MTRHDALAQNRARGSQSHYVGSVNVQTGEWSNKLSNAARCGECGRVFDLTDEDDAAEWYYGHDCEVEE